MLVIGLTGGIGSGKTTVANLFAEKGVTIIDTDQLARDVIEPGKPALEKIIQKFGQTILLPNGSLDRTALRKHIFNHPEDREWLEKLLHPLIREEMKYQAEHSTSPYCIAVIPLLFETKPNPLIDRILVVDTTEEEQIKRAHTRDNTSPQQIKAILKSQASRNQRVSGADDIIINTGSPEELIPQVDQLHQLYLILSQK